MSFDPFEQGSDYGKLVQEKLVQVIDNNPSLEIARVIRKVIENLVLAERIAEQNGIEIRDADKNKLMEREYPEIKAEVDRAMGELIGSIISREGG